MFEPFINACRSSSLYLFIYLVAEPHIITGIDITLNKNVVQQLLLSNRCTHTAELTKYNSSHCIN